MNPSNGFRVSSIFLILLAAGKSKRLKSTEPKPYIKVNNRTLVEHNIEKIQNIKAIKKTVIVYNKKHRKKLKNLGIKNLIKVIGGKTRSQSTYLALKRIKNLKCSKVLIHDTARPNVSSKLIKNVIHNLKFHNAVIPAIKVSDSIYLGINSEDLPLKIIKGKNPLGRTLILYPGASPTAEEHPSMIFLGSVLANIGFNV